MSAVLCAQEKGLKGYMPGDGVQMCLLYGHRTTLPSSDTGLISDGMALRTWWAPRPGCGGVPFRGCRVWAIQRNQSGAKYSQ